MKILFLILGMILSTSILGVELRPTLDGSDQVRFIKYLDAVRATEQAVNSVEFTNKVIDAKFTSTKLKGQEVLWKLDEGAELLHPEKNSIWEWGVGFYYKKGTKVVGWTTAKINTVWVNTAKFDHYEIWDISNNVAHEYMHKIGFDHKSASDYKSVPYAIGSLVSDLVKMEIKTPGSLHPMNPVVTLPPIVVTPEDVKPVITDPVILKPRPRPSFWQRLKSFLFGG